MPRRAVATDPEQERLIDLLVAARLVTSDDDTVELAHESLARAWPRLRAWLDDDVEGQRILRHLSGAADAWDGMGRPDSELYRGVRLAQALDWRHRSYPVLAPVEVEFLDASKRQQQTEERDTALRAHQQTRMIHRLRIALVGGGILLVLAVIAGGLAARQTSRATESSRAAQRSEVLADASRLGEESLTVDNPSTAMLLALEGYHETGSSQARTFLTAALARHPDLVGSSSLASAVLGRMDLTPDRSMVVSRAEDNSVWVFDTGSGQVVAHTNPTPDSATAIFRPNAIEVSPGGRFVAVGLDVYDAGAALRLLTLPHLRPASITLAGLPHGRSTTADVSFSADGRYLAASFVHTARNDRPPGLADVVAASVLVWNLRAPSQPPEVIHVPFVGNFPRIELSSEGSTVYVSAPLAAYDVRSHRQLYIHPSSSLGYLWISARTTVCWLCRGFVAARSTS